TAAVIASAVTIGGIVIHDRHRGRRRRAYLTSIVGGRQRNLDRFDSFLHVVIKWRYVDRRGRREGRDDGNTAERLVIVTGRGAAFDRVTDGDGQKSGPPPANRKLPAIAR